MKKIVFTAIAVASVACVVIYARTNDKGVGSNGQVAQWEKLAEEGDTAAMHRLIEFYDENSTEFVEVEAIIEPDGTELSAEEVDSINLENRKNADMARLYSDRLDYWMERGIAMNDSVALATKDRQSRNLFP